VTGHRLGRTARYRPAAWVLEVLRPYDETAINPIVEQPIKAIADAEINPVVLRRGIEERNTVDRDEIVTPSASGVLSRPCEDATAVMAVFVDTFEAVTGESLPPRNKSAPIPRLGRWGRRDVAPVHVPLRGPVPSRERLHRSRLLH
jgi:hypothetical protein